MKDKKRQEVEEALEMIEKRLRNAEEYVARNVNVEGSDEFHFDDWEGKSGHPSWMRNFMIRATMYRRARIERALKNIDSKAKDKKLTSRKRHKAT